MSDAMQEQLPIEEVADEAVPVEDAGVADVEAQPEVADEPVYDYLDIDDSFDGKYVRAKVDGEEVPVAFDELINSYSRESVSTQRFQEASAIKQEAENALRLSQALQANPGLTVQYLAQQAQMSVQDFLGMEAQQQQAAVAAESTEDEYLDPLERKLATQEQQLLSMQERIEQRDADERLGQAVGRLKSDFGVNDDQARAVVGQAMQMGVGLEMLPVIYQSMAFQASQQAAAQHTAAQTAETEKRQTAAAKAQQVVGTAPSAVGTTDEVAPNFTSIREAAMAAVESVGIQ